MPLGAVNVWLMVESPLVGLVEPSLAQKLPLWQPLLMTVSEAPDAVHPVRLLLSKPPFVIPPDDEPVMVSVIVAECVALALVPVTVSV